MKSIFEIMQQQKQEATMFFLAEADCRLVHLLREPSPANLAQYNKFAGYALGFSAEVPQSKRRAS